MSFNIAMFIQESARRKPEKTALIMDDKRMNYSQLQKNIECFSSALGALGVQRDDKIMLILPNILQFPICFFGVARLGAVNVPVNVLYKERELTYRLQDCQAKAVIVFEEFIEEVLKSYKVVDTCTHLIIVRDGIDDNSPKYRRDSGIETIYDYQMLMERSYDSQEMVFTGADEPVVILYTSGTTGDPKGAALSHFSIFYQCGFVPLEGRGRREYREGVGIAHLPFYHVFGLFNVLCATMAMGGTISLLRRFEPGKVLDVIERDGISDFAGVPTMYNRLYHHPDFKNRDLSSLVTCGCGGAPLPVELADAWEEAVGIQIQEGYGMTETGSGVSTNAVDQVDAKIGSAGQPMWGNEIKLVDDQGNSVPQGELGEVVVRGPGMMNGYHNKPDINAKSFRNGWLNTGDIGHFDEEGYLFIVDRKKEMIIRGGYNIYPRQIEEVLYEHPAVQECAVIGIPNSDLGEEVKAVLYLKSGKSATSEEIQAFCKERIAAFKYPRIVEIRDKELPKNATGKIQKRQLKN